MKRSIFLWLSLVVFSSISYSAACAKGEPPCTDCVPLPYAPAACAVNNCCVPGSGATVSRACVCTAKNSAGTVCTACSSN